VERKDASDLADDTFWAEFFGSSRTKNANGPLGGIAVVARQTPFA